MQRQQLKTDVYKTKPGNQHMMMLLFVYFLSNAVVHSFLLWTQRNRIATPKIRAEKQKRKEFFVLSHLS